MYEHERRSNALTDQDREEIANKVFAKFQDQFFMNVGKGVWKLVWRTVILCLIALAAYGAGSGQGLKFW